METTKILTSRRIFCPTHKAAFDVPATPEVLCEITGHLMSADFARAEFWEYCCSCQTYWPSQLGRGGAAAESCPSCQRNPTRHYICHECNLVSVESDEASKGKIHSISQAGIRPNCPHCAAESAASTHTHYCEEARVNLVGTRVICPFCEATLVKTKDPEVTVLLGDPCPHCQVPSEVGSVFCTTCGSTLQKVTSPPQPVFAKIPLPQPDIVMDGSPSSSAALRTDFEERADAYSSEKVVSNVGHGKILGLLAAIFGGVALMIAIAASSNKGKPNNDNSSNGNSNKQAGSSYSPPVAPCPAPHPSDSTCSGSIATLLINVNLRKSPETNGIVLAQHFNGARVCVLNSAGHGDENVWYYVRVIEYGVNDNNSAWRGKKKVSNQGQTELDRTYCQPGDEEAIDEGWVKYYQKSRQQYLLQF